MTRLTRMSFLAAVAMALVAIPMDAQQRGSSSSRGSSSASQSRSSAPSHSGGGYSSSRSSGSSASRSSGYSSSRSSSYSPSRSSGNSSSRTGATYGGQSSTRQTPSYGNSGAVTRGGLGNTSSRAQSGAVRPSQPATSSYGRQGSSATRGSAPATRTAPVTGNVQTAPRSSSRSATARPSGASRVNVNPGVSRQANQGINPRGGNTPGSNPSTVRPRVGESPRNYNGNPSRVRMDDHRNVERIHPRDREPMPFNRPARFWDHGPHCFGYRVNYLPPRHIIHYHWGVPYYYCDGLWYRHYGGIYYVCRPPFGRVFVPDVVDIVYDACRFAYYYDVYSTYRTINDNARVITEQNATIAANNATIASQNADIALNRERAQMAYGTANRLGLVQSYADASVEYFYDDGVFFTKGADGQYVVIVPPAGALVKELPDDYETITLDGQQYYKVDDTVYEMTIVDGSACFQVLGQLTGDLAARYSSLK